MITSLFKLSLLLHVFLRQHVMSTLVQKRRSRRLGPTSCTTSGSSFDKAMGDALRLKDEDVDCLVSETNRNAPAPSEVETCVSLDGSTRYFFSNEPVDSLSTSELANSCTVRYGVAVPYGPTYDGTYLEENPVDGPLGFALDGVAFVDASWGVNGGVLAENEDGPYHSSKLPPSGAYPSENELVGYAMDGFPIYGPTEFSVDVCNGRVVNGKYRYHMVRTEDVDFSLPQCNEIDPRVHNWNPIVGCFRGSTSQSRIFLDHGSRDGMFCSSPNLVTCLQAIPGDPVIVTEGDTNYKNASHCHNSGRPDRTWSPRAIIKVFSSEQVAGAVQCATLADVTVTPRSGAHGFENEACSGELIVDVSGLLSLQVDTGSKVVEFGSGHMHGQLYRKLADYGLVVPGGTENSVGTAGLWLGCGRGSLSQIYGLSCDNMLGIEFVDANGNIRVADGTTNTDMYWMARGSGGEFPGVVTKFIAQGYDMPSDVWAIKIKFRSDQIHALIQAWVPRLEELSNPSHSMFTNIHSYLGNPILAMSCYGCSAEQKAWMKAQFEEITALAGGGKDFVDWYGTWSDRMLKEEWDCFETLDDLLVRPEWPAVWAVLANGAHMLPSFDASDAMIDVIQHALENYGDGFFLFMYSMTGPHIASVPVTNGAYGGRLSKYAVHYKFIGGAEQEVKAPLREMSVSLDDAGLACKGFYNYADREYPCAAASGELWLEAHFSDVPRMRTIKASEDPNDRFMSEFKAKKWREDPNEVIFVGWPDVGDWGGTCTCPNGAVYQVGDNNDECKTLACVGGVTGSCSSENPGGAGYKVICDTPPSTPAPTPVPTPLVVTGSPTSASAATTATRPPTSSPNTTSSTQSPISSTNATVPTQSPMSSPNATSAPDTPTSSPNAAPATDKPTSSPTATPATDKPTSSPTATPATDKPTPGPNSSPIIPAPTSAPGSPAPSNAPAEPPITMTFTTEPPSGLSRFHEWVSSLVLVICATLVVVLA